MRSIKTPLQQGNNLKRNNNYLSNFRTFKFVFHYVKVHEMVVHERGGKQKLSERG